MVEPIWAAVGAGKTLLKALWSVKELCQKKRNNDDIFRELSTFITNLERDLLSLEKKTPRSNSAAWAAEALKDDLEKAAEYVRECLDRGYIKSIWSVTTIYDKLKRIREGLATSFQTKLQIIIFDVVIEQQSKQEEFRANLSRLQGALTDALGELHQVNANIRDILRAELKALVQPVLDGMAARQGGNMDLETAIVLTKSAQPQTSESEKFFGDVLANLEWRRDRRLGQEQLSAKDGAEDVGFEESQERWLRDSQDDAEDRWFEDSVTTHLMCDPVKCSDGRTYDRWTIIDNHILVSPFDKSLPEFGIVLDDVSTRTGLFRTFPEQEAVFHARRLRHRQEAMDHASEGEYGDALEKLDQVLQWARSDQDCRAKRDEVHHILESLQITVPGMSDMKPYNLISRVSSARVKGLGHISAALRDNNTSGSLLHELYLDGNDIGDAAGAQRVAGILTHSPALRALRLFGIGMDDAGHGALVIADAVARSTTLNSLTIGYDRQKKREQAAMLILLVTALSRSSSSLAAAFNQSISQLRLLVTGLPEGKNSAVEARLAEAVAGMLRSNATLEFLSVSSFFVTRGLSGLAHNKSILHLELVHHHSLHDEEVDPALLAILPKCMKLQVLHLKFEKPYGRSKFTKEFFPGLKDSNCCIKKLVLDGWDGLDDQMFEDLIRSLSSNTTLEDISIKGTSWEEQGIAERRLAKALEGERLKPQLRALLAELESESPSLRELPSVDVWGNYFDCDCQDAYAECKHRGEGQWDVRVRLLAAIGNCRTLKKVNLNPSPEWRKSWYSVRQVEALALLSGLQRNDILEELNLPCYKGFVATTACLQALTAIIGRPGRSLKVLGLQYMGLSAQGLGDIAAAIRRRGSSALSTLSLSGNHIGNAVGAQHLADILSNLPTLHLLTISDIGMDEGGALLIGEALAHTTTLTGLRIGDYAPHNPKQLTPMFIIPLLRALVWPDGFSCGPIRKKGGPMKALKKWWDNAGMSMTPDSARSHQAEIPPPAFNHSIRMLVLDCPGGQEAVEPGLGGALARVLRSNRALDDVGLASFFIKRERTETL